jgi:hypothetical protein
VKDRLNTLKRHAVPNVTAQSPRVTSAAYLPPQGGPIANQNSWNYPQKKRRKLSGDGLDISSSSPPCSSSAA